MPNQSFAERFRQAVDEMERPLEQPVESLRRLVIRCARHPEVHMEQPPDCEMPVLVCPHPGCETTITLEFETPAGGPQ